MNLKQLILPTAALGAAAALLIPAQSDAYTLLGGALNTTQRDFRIFDSFTDPTANDNVTPDPNFPGYTGCELAIWKACTEWASELHGGTGDGDPHQPGGLGSGGANLDAVFQGNATSAGTTNGNTFSELSGSSGGILAFTEDPISDGWRIRFYSNWTWHDGPGTPASGYDIQGVACRQYGNALGLDDSPVTGSTMFHFLEDATGAAKRSIEADDIAGVQAIYGVAAVSKPRITGISFSSGMLTIFGSNFDLSANDVWFTPIPPSATDVPVQAAGLPSNGSQITLAIPPMAGSGDVFVKLAGTTGSALSNGWPIDSANFPAPPGTAYCFGDGSLPTACPCTLPNFIPVPSGGPDAGCANSFNGYGAKLGSAGSVSPDSIVFTTVIGGNSASFGLLLKGNGSDPNGVANGDGVRCVDGQLIRFGGHNAGTNGAPLGTWTYPNSVQTIPVSMATLQQAGQSAYYQLFYRHTFTAYCTSATANLSNGYEIGWP